MSVFLKCASRRFSIVTILQKGRLGRGVAAGFQSQSRFQLAKLFVFRCGCGSKIATASERVLNLDTIAIQRNFGGAQADVQCLLRDAHPIVRSTCLDERPGVRITRLCPIVVQFFLWKESVHTNSILECLRLSIFGPLWLRLLGNVFLTIWLVCGIGHTWIWNGRACIFQASCPRLDKAWISSFTKHTFNPRALDQSVALQEEWGQLSSQFGERWLHYYDIFARNGFKSYFMVIRKFIFNSTMGDLLIHMVAHPLEQHR